MSCVGRSLGTLAGSLIIERSGFKDFQAQEFGNIVAAACLAHDIGNPPFGHSGEDAIRTWFEGVGKSYLKDLASEQVQDFLEFAGNAQGFRVLSRLQNNINGEDFNSHMQCSVLIASIRAELISHLWKVQ